MDPILSAELMRMLERIIVVFGGVVSIVLGYKLFMKAELRQDASGKWKFLGFEGSLIRTGPGVFFCLFGVYVLATSLSKPIDISVTKGGVIGVPTLSQLEELQSIIKKLPEGEEKKKALELISKMQPAPQEELNNFTEHMYLYVPPRKNEQLM